MQTINALIELAPDFDRPLADLSPPQRDLVLHFEKISHDLIDSIHTHKNHTTHNVDLTSIVRTRLISRELFRYVPLSKLCFPFEDDELSNSPLLRTNRTTNIAVQIRLHLASIAKNIIGFQILHAVSRHLEICCQNPNATLTQPCYDICSILFTALPFNPDHRSKHINLRGYLLHLGKSLLVLSNSQSIQFHCSLTQSTRSPALLSKTDISLIRHLRELPNLIRYSATQDDFPIVRPIPSARPVPPSRDSTPTNLTPSPSISEISSLAPSRDQRTLNSLFIQAHQRPERTRTRYFTNVRFVSSDSSFAVLDVELTLSPRHCVKDILTHIFDPTLISFPKRDPPFTGEPLTQFFSTLIDEHYTFLSSKIHNSFSTSSTRSELPTVLDCINIFHVLSLARELVLDHALDSPQLIEIAKLMPLTFSLFASDPVDRDRRFDHPLRQALLWTLGPVCSSFSYYAFLQLCIYIHGFTYPQGYQSKFDSLDHGTDESFYHDYPFCNVHYLRIWHYFLHFEGDYPEDIQIPEFIFDLAQQLQAKTFSRLPRLEDHSFYCEVNGSKFSNYAVRFDSVYDNPLVHPSLLDHRDLRTLERHGYLFLPTFTQQLDFDKDDSDYDDEDYDDIDDHYIDTYDTHES
jgi:hypothetical protein